MIIIMGGSTGAGKTTHGKLLSIKNDFKYISSGDVARSLMDSTTDALFKNGQLSPHEELIRKAIKDQISESKVCVIDGFPRLKEQYELLMDWSFQLNRPISLVWLRPSRSVLVHRWGMRHRDAYDNETAALKRDTLYNESTIPVLEEMNTRHDALRIDIGETDEPIDSVQNLIQKWLMEATRPWARS